MSTNKTLHEPLLAYKAKSTSDAFLRITIKVQNKRDEQAISRTKAQVMKKKQAEEKLDMSCDGVKHLSIR